MKSNLKISTIATLTLAFSATVKANDDAAAMFYYRYEFDRPGASTSKEHLGLQFNNRPSLHRLTFEGQRYTQDLTTPPLFNFEFGQEGFDSFRVNGLEAFTQKPNMLGVDDAKKPKKEINWVIVGAAIVGGLALKEALDDDNNTEQSTTPTPPPVD